MQDDGKKFLRQGEPARRLALISAALELISEEGPAAATVRAIAERAGVTPGLIRHYFSSKDELTRAAYREVMEKMTMSNKAVLDAAPSGAEARLAAFVAASLRPPVVDPGAMSLWANFLHMARRDPLMRGVHEATYMQYRDLLQGLIADLPRDQDADGLRTDAIACNAVIDGLWLEGSALPEAFPGDELAQIGVRAVGNILSVDLINHLLEVEETE